MEILIRKGTSEDTEPFIQLLYEVRQGMEQKSWLYLDSPEEIREMMRAGTMELWVAMDGQRLAGGFDILKPGLDEYNYGYDLDFSQEELLRVTHIDTAAVRPDYRGLGLQRRLIQAAEDALKTRGSHILLCTVHPDNRFSLNNVLRQGYVIQRRVPKYGSERYVLRKDIP